MNLFDMLRGDERAGNPEMIIADVARKNHWAGIPMYDWDDAERMLETTLNIMYGDTADRKGSINVIIARAREELEKQNPPSLIWSPSTWDNDETLQMMAGKGLSLGRIADTDGNIRYLLTMNDAMEEIVAKTLGRQRALNSAGIVIQTQAVGSGFVLDIGRVYQAFLPEKEQLENLPHSADLLAKAIKSGKSGVVSRGARSTIEITAEGGNTPIKEWKRKGSLLYGPLYNVNQGLTAIPQLEIKFRPSNYLPLFDSTQISQITSIADNVANALTPKPSLSKGK